jgi:hypothetical protein
VLAAIKSVNLAVMQGFQIGAHELGILVKLEFIARRLLVTEARNDRQLKPQTFLGTRWNQLVKVACAIWDLD